ncbi:azurin [Gilvimarinus sp. 2_MG-2023]|uniref:azurin n=1 Tax=Gilvimarinus sp. 2_MG-2023 TaxID=3062666 RepID=UPI0034A0FAD1
MCKNQVMKITVLVGSLVFAFSAATAGAAECEVTVDSTDQMRFDTEAISIPSSCESFTVNLTHSGNLPKNAMGHNWVLTEKDNIQGVVQDGMSAGLENQYVKPGDERVLAHTDVIGGGESTSVTFKVDELDAAKEYSFICSFPGHYALMQGSVAVE